MALPKCYLVDGVAEEKFRVYGLAIQLYALRSKSNMGIGDFTDLKNIIKQVAENGGDIVGVNPLGAMFPESRTDVSPYRTLSRVYLNYAYVDLTVVPEYQEAPQVRILVETPDVKAEIERLRRLDKVDYYGIFKLKLQLLKAMFGYFRAEHLDAEKGISPRGRTFLDL